MGSVYAQAGSSGGSAYAGSGGKAKPSGHGHGGAVGFVEHLGKDAKDAALGLPTGVKALAEHPVRSAKGIGSIYADTYGHGFHHFLHNFYEHPLGPLLDATSLLTLPFGVGEGLAGSRIATGILGTDSKIIRASRALGGAYSKGELRGARSLAEAGKLRKVEVEEPTATDLNKLTYQRVGKLPRRFAAAQIDRLLKALPGDTPLVGELARYNRLERQLLQRGPRALGLKIGEFRAAAKRLKGDEKIAFHFHATGVHPEDYARLLEREQAKLETPERAAMIEKLRSPEFRDAYDSLPHNPRLRYALEKGREYSQALGRFHLADAEKASERTISEVKAQAEDRLQRLGPNASQKQIDTVEQARDAKIQAAKDGLAETQRVFAERPFLHQRLVNGAHFERAIDDPALRHVTEEYGKAKAEYEKELAKDSTSDRERFVAAGHRLERASQQLAKQEVRAAKRYTGGNVERLRELTNAHRPQLKLIDTPESTIEALRGKLNGEPEPFYLPDIRMGEVEQGPVKAIARTGRGKAPVEASRFLRQDRGVLFLSARLALDPETLGVAFQEYARNQLASSIHDALEENAILIPGDTLPKGYTWLREKSFQRLPHSEVTEEPIQLRQVKGIDDFTSRTEITHFAVPEGLVEELAGQFAKSNKFIRLLYEKPTLVWRAIILNLRVGFLTNNVIGQHFLLLYHYFGTSLVQAWASYLREVRPRAYETFKRGVLYHALRKNVAPLPAREFKHIEQESTAPLIFGTHYRTQVPGASEVERNIGGKLVGGAERAGRGLGPLSAKLSEDMPRELALRTTVVREAKKLGERIPRQTEQFNELARRLLDNPEVADRAIVEANRALGNYLDLGDIGLFVRQFVPFYGWLRAITKIAANSAVDTPGRTDLLVRLGQVGSQERDAALGPLPEYLQGLVPLGKSHVLSTRGLNPYASLPDVLNALSGAAFTGNRRGELFQQLNPLIQTAIEALSGKNPVTGRDVKAPGGLVGRLVEGNIKELPPYFLGKALITGKGTESSRFGATGRGGTLGQYVGLPIRPKPHAPEKKTHRRRSGGSQSGSAYAG